MTDSSTGRSGCSPDGACGGGSSPATGSPMAVTVVCRHLIMIIDKLIP